MAYILKPLRVIYLYTIRPEEPSEIWTNDFCVALQEEEGSPTSKLHRLLVESRQMVQNLEQHTVNTPAVVSDEKVSR